MSSGGKHKVSNVFRLGKMYNKMFILGISMLLAFYMLYMFVPESTTKLQMHPKVQYVDSKTGKVLSDFEFPGGLELEDGGNELEMQKIMSQSGITGKPDALDNEKAGMQQLQDGTDKKDESESGDCVIPGRRANATFVS